MQAYGSDRFRMAGGKVILFSAIPKGWKARIPKQGTHAEHPGTAVLWDDQYFEVISASMGPAGITYVLVPWREDMTIRTFEHYDEASEGVRVADYAAMKAQQKASLAASVFSMFLGNLPAVVQKRIGDDYGIAPARMTALSCIPPLVLFAGCVLWAANAAIEQSGAPVPIGLWLISGALLLEAGIRYNIAMSQNRGVGTMWGMLLYILVHYLSPKSWKLTSPFEVERGNAVFTIAPTDDIVLRDAITMRTPWFTLLPAADQQYLATRFGYDYTRGSRGLAVAILVCALLGAATSWMKLDSGTGSVATLSSLFVAGFLIVEQIFRLIALQRGPAGSVLGLLVRPFVRKYVT
jgi:hypothetical protein